MKKERILLGALAAALIGASLPAYASGKTEGDSWTSLPNEVAVNDKGTLTVGYVMIGSESDWRIACNRSIQETFTRENGYSLLTSDAQQKAEKQIKAVREFINQEVDYILLDPLVENGWDASLEEAREAGIPVIVFDREVASKEEDDYVAWLGSDFYLEGQRACAYLKEYLERTGYEGELNIVHIQGTLDSSAQIGRTRALDDALLENKTWTLLDRKEGEFTTAKGKEVMVDMLENYGDKIQVVYCENDNEAYGAISAIEEAGLKAGTSLKDGEILVLSFDSTHGGLSMTKDGEILVNTECAPLYGPLLSQLIGRIENGEEVSHIQYVREEQFSSLAEPGEVTVGEEVYPVTLITDELLEARSY